MNLNKKIYVSGHQGMVGSAIIRQLGNFGCKNLVIKSHAELDLVNQKDVFDFFDSERPEEVYLAAAKVGGIYANNKFPADFIYQNLMIEANVIHAAFKFGVKKLLFLGSSCIYPKYSDQPIKENYLLTGKLESTNEPYAIAKIAGIKLCESYNRQYGTSHGLDYRSVMPTNLYGPNDNYHPENSHVIPGLIKRFHDAKINRLPSVLVWGTGQPRREFLYVDDLARACIFLMELSSEVYEKNITPMESHINVGYGSDITIEDLARKVALVVGYSGDIIFDLSKPDGTPQKLMDSSLINGMGWMPVTGITDGLKLAYKDFLSSEFV